MKIELPYRLDRINVNNLMSQVVTSEGQPVNSELEFDFTKLNFIEPAGVTALSNLFEWLLKNETKASISYPKQFGKTKWCPIQYLDDSEFFKKYLGHKLDKNSGVRPTTIPLQNVAFEESHGWLNARFIPWLSQQILVKEESLANVEICLGEIFNNIRDHSFEKIGCIYAQHFPNKNIVNFSVSDFGVGIPYNVRKKRSKMNDAEALEQAVEEGFTTRSTDRNLGAGLHTLIVSTVYKTNGSVHIHSGFGILNAYYGDNEIKIESSLTGGYYPGTFLDVNIDTNIILKEDKYDDQEEFIW